MKTARFLQFHTLHSYPAALLNRDDSGLAKRLLYGGATRTRISSQCLKRHWRTAEGDDAFDQMEGFEQSIRSREIVNRCVVDPLCEELQLDEKSVKALADGFNTGVYGKKGSDAKSRQALLLGEPEIAYLKREARRLIGENGTSDKDLSKAISEFFKDSKSNMAAMRNNTQLPGGLAAALFGRMVTSDPEANIDAAIHVAHAFTVHGEESESDYFSVVDDLRTDDDDAGAAHIGDMELTAGLFYGYVVVDLPALVANTAGVNRTEWLDTGTDRTLASEVVRRLVALIATVTPGAKLGSTAPYSHASMMLAEAGNRQPRSLAEAFRSPINPNLEDTLVALDNQIKKFDGVYGQADSRRYFSTEDCDIAGATRCNCDDLAVWVAEIVDKGQVVTA